MNQPLTIQPDQVTFSPPPTNTDNPSYINPTPSSPGMTFNTPTPTINVTLKQPATITVIYIPKQPPSNVYSFTVIVYLPNTTVLTFPSTMPPSAGASTTPFGGASTTPSVLSSQTTTTPITTSIQPLSDSSPRVDFPPNFQVPTGTVIGIMITATTTPANPTAVRIRFFSLERSMDLSVTYAKRKTFERDLRDGRRLKRHP
jgi:hypothetical protein